jgi:Flp pilus assembly pilin Flp
VRTFIALLRDDNGASLVEYAMIAAAVALPLLALGAAIATNAAGQLTTTTSNLQKLGTNPP